MRPFMYGQGSNRFAEQGLIDRIKCRERLQGQISIGDIARAPCRSQVPPESFIRELSIEIYLGEVERSCDSLYLRLDLRL